MASIFTTEDRDNIKAAMITLAVEGSASVSVAGETVTAHSLDQLRKLLDMVSADLAAAGTGFGMRMVKTIPPSPG